MLLFLMPVYSFAFMPILTLINVAKFKSELLFVTKDKEKSYTIHFGSLFDCILSGLFTGDRGRFKEVMMYSLAEGLLNIVRDVENGEIPEDAAIMGSSYFFSERTAAKFGFSTTKTLNSHKVIIMLNIAEIALVYSMSQGRIAMPNFGGFKSVKATAHELVANKVYIESLVGRLGPKVLG